MSNSKIREWLEAEPHGRLMVLTNHVEIARSYLRTQGVSVQHPRVLLMAARAAMVFRGRQVNPEDRLIRLYQARVSTPFRDRMDEAYHDAEVAMHTLTDSEREAVLEFERDWIAYAAAEDRARAEWEANHS